MPVMFINERTHWPEFSFTAHYPACVVGALLVIIIGHFIAKKKRAEHEANLKLHRIDRSSAETSGKEA